MSKTIIEVVKEIEAAVFFPTNCRLDIQWKDDAIIVTRDGPVFLSFAILRATIDDNLHIRAAKHGLKALLSGGLPVWNGDQWWQK